MSHRREHLRDRALPLEEIQSSEPIDPRLIAIVDNLFDVFSFHFTRTGEGGEGQELFGRRGRVCSIQFARPIPLFNIARAERIPKISNLRGILQSRESFKRSRERESSENFHISAWTLRGNVDILASLEPWFRWSLLIFSEISR